MDVGAPVLPAVAEFSRIWLRREVRFADGRAAEEEEEVEKSAEGLEEGAEMAAGLDEEVLGEKIAGGGTTAAAE